MPLDSPWTRATAAVQGATLRSNEVMDALAAEVCNHESSHAVAAVLLGRRLFYVSRDRNLCGTTFSTRGDSEPIYGLVALLAPYYSGDPTLSHLDLEKVDALARSDPRLEIEVFKAHEMARELVKRPDFRSAHRAIRWALFSHPFLTGEEVALLIALDKEEHV